MNALNKENHELWSLIIRKRDKFTCQKCGKKSKKLAAAHIFAEDNKNVGLELDDGIVLCYYCHIIWCHRHPVEFTLWIMKFLGEENFKNLEERAISTEKRPFDSPEEINFRLKYIFRKTWGKTYEEYLQELRGKRKEAKLKKEVKQNVS